jgi:DNA-binding GntR family transcriptional regulator
VIKASKSLKPETLRTQVENHLREEIVSGRLRPGERLIERELCESLDISRPSLREALRKLEAEKLIVLVPHRGPVVANMTLLEARHLYALRRLLESYAAREFTLHAGDGDVARLATVVERLKRHAAKNARRGVLEAKAEFYSILLSGCGNVLVKEILDGVLSRVSLLRHTSLMLPERLPESMNEITALLECIRKRDADGAHAMSQKHVENAEKAALGVFQNQLKNIATKDTETKNAAVKNTAVKNTAVKNTAIENTATKVTSTEVDKERSTT